MKIALKIYRLRFTSPLHISNIRGDYNSSERIIHSDMIYAAFMQSWSIIGKPEWISKNPEFSISSMFPFTKLQGKSFLYFFRKPYEFKRDLKTNKEEENPGDAKKFKKVLYFDQEYFEKALNGCYSGHVADAKGQYLSKMEFDTDFISSGIIPRIRWHRNELEDAEPFYMEQLFFKEGSGLFFMFIGNIESQAQVEVALRYLSETGIGTDRSIGYGRFEFETDTISLNTPDTADYCINLSLFCPDSFETLNQMMDEKSSYDFIPRGGWIGEPNNTYRKKSVYMFNVGSVFKKDVSGITSFGKTVDLKPFNTPLPVNNPIFRVGKALFLPICL
ncbi:MAG: type III-A CRISPR-associated RAMP protein Csm4 [Bacteroidetes bacterium]|nr:type III-A CRISPR-associated RAMP protein Csm4 [Bacteroidota bacterium]